MKMHVVRKFFPASLVTFLAVSVFFVACSGQQATQTSKVEVRYVTDYTPSDLPDVVATIGDETISTDNIISNNAYLMRLFKADEGLYEAEKRRHQEFTRLVDEFVASRLIEQEAKQKKVSSEKLLETELKKYTSKITEKDAKAFYDDKKINRPYDQLKDKIVEYLENEEKGKARAKYVDALKKKYNAEIKVAEFAKPKPLPPRQKVDIAASNPSIGPTDAPITIVEFSDYQCPFCSRAEATVKEVMAKYGKKIRLVYRHFPLDFHQQALPAAVAAACAQDQGKFWEYHELLFGNQRELTNENFVKFADQLKLDKSSFEACLSASEKEALVRQDMSVGRSLGVSGTPAFFINGRMISGARPFDDFAELIEADLSNPTS